MADAINQKRYNDKLYQAGVTGSPPIYVYASSIAAAKQKAIEHYRVKKKYKHLVWAMI